MSGGIDRHNIVLHETVKPVGMNLWAFCIAAAVVSVTFAQDTYKSKWKAEDIDNILSNDRLLKAYVNCLLDKGPCTVEAKNLKDRLPEALATHCEKCTNDQKVLGKTAAIAVMKNHPEYWKQLMAKYDPDRKYEKSFQDYLNS